MKETDINQHAVDDLLDLVSFTERQEYRAVKYQVMLARARTRRKRNKLKFSIAAVMIIFLGTSAWFTFSHSGEEPGILYQTYYERYVFPLDYRSQDHNPDSPNSAFIDFNKGQIIEANEKAMALMQADPDDPDIILLLAFIKMEQGKFNEAITHLDRMMIFGGSYESTALWYKGLCCLANDETDQAISTFKILRKSDDIKIVRRSSQILRKVKQ